MANEPKQSPSIAPPERSFADSFAQALKDETARRAVSVKLKVRGGIPQQAYTMDFALQGDGTAECRFACSQTERKGHAPRTALPDKDFASLMKKVESVLQLPEQRPSFLPDTVVGILEVSDGATVRRIYFAADPEQAKTQGKVPPPEVLDLADAIYKVGARLTKQRSVKP